MLNPQYTTSNILINTTKTIFTDYLHRSPHAHEPQEKEPLPNSQPKPATEATEEDKVKLTGSLFSAGHVVDNEPTEEFFSFQLTPAKPEHQEQEEPEADTKQKKHQTQPGKRSFFKRGNKKFFWNSKPLPQSWRVLAKHKTFKKFFSVFEQKLVKLFYKEDCFARLSYAEMARLFGVSRKQAVKFVDRLIDMGLAVKEERFHKNKKKNIVTKRRARNYVKLTTEGQKYFNELMGRYFEYCYGDNLVKKSCNKKKYQKKTSGFKEKNTGVTHKGELCSKKCHEKKTSNFSGDFSTEQKNDMFTTRQEANKDEENQPKGSFSNEEEYVKHLEDSLDKLLKQEEREDNHKNSARRRQVISLLTKYKFDHRFNEIYSGALNDLYEEPLEKVEKTLKTMRKKEDNGYRFKTFWGWFTWHIKHKKKFKSWFGKLADDFTDSLNNEVTPETKKLAQGHYTSSIISVIQQLERETCQKLTRSNVERLVKENTHKLYVALDHVVYRMKLKRDDVKEVYSWVGLLFATLKKKSVEDIMNLRRGKAKQA